METSNSAVPRPARTNTFTTAGNGFIINSGGLLQNFSAGAAQFGGASAPITLNGGTLQVYSNGSYAYNNPVSVTANSTIGMENTSAATPTFGTLTINGGSNTITLTVNNGGVTNSSAGAPLIFANTVLMSNLVVNDSSAPGQNTGDTAEINLGTITQSGTVASLTVTGTGPQQSSVIVGPGSNYTGDTTVLSGGYLRLGGTNGIADTLLTVNAGGVFDLAKGPTTNNVDFNQTIRGLSGNGSVYNTGNNTSRRHAHNRW